MKRRKLRFRREHLWTFGAGGGLAVALWGCANDAATGATGTPEAGPPLQNDAAADAASPDAASPRDPCADIQTPPCLVAIYEPGRPDASAAGGCRLFPVADDTACDDGSYCTVSKACSAGRCVGGLPRNCTNGDPCALSVCDETAKKCEAAPLPEGAACESPVTNLCQTSASCHSGKCIPVYFDCSLAPGTDDCNVGSCDPSTGACNVAPGNDGTECTPLGAGACAGVYIDVSPPTCKAGVCQGGLDPCAQQYAVAAPNGVCASGSCNPGDGSCVYQPVAPGQQCEGSQATADDCTAQFVLGVTGGQCCSVSTCVASVGCVSGPAPAGHPCPIFDDQCNVGACDGKGKCNITAINEGTGCNDHDLCTTGETCQSGSCTGGLTAPGTTVYFKEDFNTPLFVGWTLDRCAWSQLIGDHSNLNVQSTTGDDLYTPIKGTGHDLVMGGGFLANTILANGVPAPPPFPQTACSGSWAYATAPTIDLSKAQGSVYLTFYHQWYLGNDAYNGGQTEVAVDVFDGSLWQRALDVQVPALGDGLSESSWHVEIIDVTPFKSAAFALRFAQLLFGFGAPYLGIDDVTVASAPCAPGTIRSGE
jgi:hypothetical protein